MDLGYPCVEILDTTLRDGEQTPGVAFSREDKIRIALQLETLGVDVIEAGFSASSRQDSEAVRAVCDAVLTPRVAALSRMLEADILATYESLKTAARPRLHVLIPTSPIHRRAKLKMTTDEVLVRIAAGVALARDLMATCGGDVQFAAEDATRTEESFLIEVFQCARESGATVLNVPDTVGSMTPHSFHGLMNRLAKTIPSASQWSVHCHNDLGLATANSLSAIQAGARQVEVCMNGLGERAGNAPLEEIVMILRSHRESLGFDTNIVISEITQTALLVAELSGRKIPANKPILGENIFMHASGIHQQGVLADHTTYEFLNASELGRTGGQVILGKQSGRAAVLDALNALGIATSGVQLDEILEMLKIAAMDVKVVAPGMLAEIAQVVITRNADSSSLLGDL